jgi:(3,5-dihydroxyphenyl)acetyl-CoA 1,2-dioxygenase
MDSKEAVGIAPDFATGEDVGAPSLIGDWSADRRSFGEFFARSNALFARLPPKSRRGEREQRSATSLLTTARAAREAFLRHHVRSVYDALTDGRRRFVRVEDLVAKAADVVPGLVPSAATLAAEDALVQGDKDGHEIDHGIFVAHVLADADCGRHLCHAMLLPHPDSAPLVEAFARTGRLDLGTVQVEREGRAAIVNLANLPYLNAEDESTLLAQELAVDVCTLDAASDIGVLRGAVQEKGKYAGKRVYSTGINLTHLYHGKIPYLWYLRRELGWIHKVFRGVADPRVLPDDIFGAGTEKLWISAIDAFAIGGGCQYTLVTDYNIAARDAYLTLPARKEGIVPGAANLRLPRFTGDRVARQAVMMERRIDCDTPEGRMVIDRIAEPGTLDDVVREVVDGITRSGVVSAASNRKAFRIAHEPLDRFRQYMAVYAREQAYCHFSPALIRNLEQFWNANQRKVA